MLINVLIILDCICEHWHVSPWQLNTNVSNSAVSVVHCLAAFFLNKIY